MEKRRVLSTPLRAKLWNCSSYSLCIKHFDFRLPTLFSMDHVGNLFWSLRVFLRTHCHASSPAKTLGLLTKQVQYTRSHRPSSQHILGNACSIHTSLASSMAHVTICGLRRIVINLSLLCHFSQKVLTSFIIPAIHKRVI